MWAVSWAMPSNTTIRNCANLGAVTGSGSVGGIIGGFVGSGAVITGCYNTGAVRATGNTAGGMFGGSGYAKLPLLTATTPARSGKRLRRHRRRGQGRT